MERKEIEFEFERATKNTYRFQEMFERVWGYDWTDRERKRRWGGNSYDGEITRVGASQCLV